MKAVILAGFLFASLVAAVLSDATSHYAPEYEYGAPQEHVRTKRHVAALPFLAGVAAGGIFGPILYNRLYGWKPVRAWKEPAVEWKPEPQGWQAPQQQQNQGWEAPQQNQGWEGQGQSGGY